MFDGKVGRKAIVSLGGRKRDVKDVASIKAQSIQQREERDRVRNQNNKAMKLQSCFRSFYTRKSVVTSILREFDVGMNRLRIQPSTCNTMDGYSAGVMLKELDGLLLKLLYIMNHHRMAVNESDLFRLFQLLQILVTLTSTNLVDCSNSSNHVASISNSVLKLLPHAFRYIYSLLSNTSTSSNNITSLRMGTASVTTTTRSNSMILDSEDEYVQNVLHQDPMSMSIENDQSLNSSDCLSMNECLKILTGVMNWINTTSAGTNSTSTIHNHIVDWIQLLKLMRVLIEHCAANTKDMDASVESTCDSIDGWNGLLLTSLSNYFIPLMTTCGCHSVSSAATTSTTNATVPPVWLLFVEHVLSIPNLSVTLTTSPALQSFRTVLLSNLLHLNQRNSDSDGSSGSSSSGNVYAYWEILFSCCLELLTNGRQQQSTSTNTTTNNTCGTTSDCQLSVTVLHVWCNLLLLLRNCVAATTDVKLVLDASQYDSLFSQLLVPMASSTAACSTVVPVSITVLIWKVWWCWWQLNEQCGSVSVLTLLGVTSEYPTVTTSSNTPAAVATITNIDEDWMNKLDQCKSSEPLKSLELLVECSKRYSSRRSRHLQQQKANSPHATNSMQQPVELSESFQSVSYIVRYLLLNGKMFIDSFQQSMNVLCTIPSTAVRINNVSGSTSQSDVISLHMLVLTVYSKLLLCLPVSCPLYLKLFSQLQIAHVQEGLAGSSSRRLIQVLKSLQQYMYSHNKTTNTVMQPEILLQSLISSFSQLPCGLPDATTATAVTSPGSLHSTLTEQITLLLCVLLGREVILVVDADIFYDANELAASTAAASSNATDTALLCKQDTMLLIHILKETLYRWCWKPSGSCIKQCSQGTLVQQLLIGLVDKQQCIGFGNNALITVSNATMNVMDVDHPVDDNDADSGSGRSSLSSIYTSVSCSDQLLQMVKSISYGSEMTTEGRELQSILSKVSAVIKLYNQLYSRYTRHYRPDHTKLSLESMWLWPCTYYSKYTDNIATITLNNLLFPPANISGTAISSTAVDVEQSNVNVQLLHCEVLEYYPYCTGFGSLQASSGREHGEDAGQKISYAAAALLKAVLCMIPHVIPFQRRVLLFEHFIKLDRMKVIDEANVALIHARDQMAQMEAPIMSAIANSIGDQVTAQRMARPNGIRRPLTVAISGRASDTLTASGFSHESIRLLRNVNINHYGPAIGVNVRRNHIIEDAYKTLEAVESEQLVPEYTQLTTVQRLKLKFRAGFISDQGHAETGIDGGGLFKELMDCSLREAFDPQHHYFLATSEQWLIPNPQSQLQCTYPPAAGVVNKKLRADLQYYAFIGKLIGKAVYERILVDSQLSVTVLNAFIGKRNQFDDLIYFDQQLLKSLQQLKGYLSAPNSESLIDDLGLTFETSATGGTVGSQVELEPGGANTPVNKSNIIRYIYKLVNFKLNEEGKVQLNALLEGFRSIISQSWVNMFSASEMQMLIGGASRPLDLPDLMGNCAYGSGYHASQPYIQGFWQIVSEMSQEDQSNLLKFVTSCGRQPLLGFKQLNPPFCIQKIPTHASDSIDEANRREASAMGSPMPAYVNAPKLPSAGTCMNLLKLPEYNSIEMLREKLLYAIRSQSGFELT